jgi:spore coat-associated protein N
MALRKTLTPLLVVLVILAAGPLAVANAGKRRDPSRGRIHLVASKRGPILSRRNLAPGHRVAGVVTITNTGTLAGSFTLTAVTKRSRLLASRLRLRVRERKRGRQRSVYAGSLAGFRGAKLGRIGPGRARTFHFDVVLPSTGDDNRLQGLRTSADFTWKAVQVSRSASATSR